MDAAAVQTRKLGFVEKLSYGCGDFGYSLAYNMASAFLLYYYTNVVGLPAAAVGTIFLAARLLDAVIDILVGIAVDKTRSRWGRTRPYFLFTAVPYSVIFVLVFMVPDWSVNAQLVYAFLTFKALGILLSLGSIPYTALMPMMTRATDERLKLSGMRSISTSLSVILGTAATMPLVGLFGGGDEQRGFMSVAILFAGFSLIAIFMLFRNCKERFEDEGRPDFAVLPAIGEMLRNRAWWVCFLFTLLYFVRFGAMISLTAYFAIEVLGRPWMISVLLPAISGMLLLSAFIAPPILSRTGIRMGCFAALVLSILLFAALPFAESSPPLFIAIYLAASVATSVTITGIFTMAAESVDFHQSRFGVRNEGLLSSGISLATKVGMAIGTSMIAFTLATAGYRAGAVTEAAREAIRWSYYGWPILLLAIQAGVILLWPMSTRRAMPGEPQELQPAS
ncbi:MAG: MFS transporter [Alphaproteobacteria bacterium HGW-Alphaproteobacteria-16]|nr:MAG: MFS transporter [Alphaproteobacteria bacterium HGW-Alphaproteobacteria-16]